MIIRKINGFINEQNFINKAQISCPLLILKKCGDLWINVEDNTNGHLYSALSYKSLISLVKSSRSNVLGYKRRNAKKGQVRLSFKLCNKCLVIKKVGLIVYSIAGGDKSIEKDQITQVGCLQVNEGNLP